MTPAELDALAERWQSMVDLMRLLTEENQRLRQENARLSARHVESPPIVGEG